MCVLLPNVMHFTSRFLICYVPPQWECFRRLQRTTFRRTAIRNVSRRQKLEDYNTMWQNISLTKTFTYCKLIYGYDVQMYPLKTLKHSVQFSAFWSGQMTFDAPGHHKLTLEPLHLPCTMEVACCPGKRIIQNTKNQMNLAQRLWTGDNYKRALHVLHLFHTWDYRYIYCAPMTTVTQTYWGPKFRVYKWSKIVCTLNS